MAPKRSFFGDGILGMVECSLWSASQKHEQYLNLSQRLHSQHEYGQQPSVQKEMTVVMEKD